MGLMASGSIVADQLADGSVDGRIIASGSIDWQHFAPGVREGLPTPMLAPLTAVLSARLVANETSSTSGAIFTANEQGLYRVSTYAVVTQGGLLNAANLAVRLDWHDSTRQQTTRPIQDVPLATSGAMGHGCTTMQVASGTPIILTVSLGSVAGPPHYDAYGVVERLM